MKATKSRKWTKPKLSDVRKDYTSPTGYTRTYYYHPTGTRHSAARLTELQPKPGCLKSEAGPP